MEPVISIICNTYNHEKYISDALDSFLMQQIKVPFEILVHDDASTDSTADIIRQYEAKYPDIVKPIYQKENQYSRGVSITAEIQIPRAKGRYVAFCEGDDYWIDPQKLQIQYDFMESHTEYSACCHAYSMVDKDRNVIKECKDFSEDCIVPMRRLLGNQLEVPHFATLFARNDALKGLRREFLGHRCNDMIIRIFCSLKGDIYYINKNMSCYRRFTEGSWTNRVAGKKEAFAKAFRESNLFLANLDKYTNGKYKKDIDESIDKREFKIALLENRYKDAKKSLSFKEASFKTKCYIRVGCIFPKLISKLRSK